MKITYADDYESEELQLFQNQNENQLAHFFEPELGLFVAESPNVIERAMAAGYEPYSFLMEERFLPKVEQFDVPVYVADKKFMMGLTGSKLIQGMLGIFRRRKEPAAEEILEGAKRIAVLCNVENPTNLGAIFRSAAALNMDAVIITDDSSDPLYRRASRVSMGTVFQVPWAIVKRENFIPYLQDMGFRTVAMALTEDSVRLDAPKLAAEEKLAIILGNEGFGLTEEEIGSCDYRVMIPMSHGVDSLNVATAGAIAFYELGKNNQE